MMLWSLREDDITERCHLFLGEGSRVIEAREDVFTRDGRVCAQQHIHALSVREHPHDLMNRNTHTADACVAVAGFGVNRNTLVHGVKVAEAAARSKGNCMYACNRGDGLTLAYLTWLAETEKHLSHEHCNS